MDFRCDDDGLDTIEIGATLGILRKARAFNLAAGMGPGQDRLPGFLRCEPLAPGQSVFDVKDDDLDRVFGEYPP